MVLADLRARFEGHCGSQLDRLILFGSQARGEGNLDSDIDILVVLADDSAIEEHKARAIDIAHELCLQYDTLISCIVTTRETIDLSGLPFYRNVRREGVAI